MNEVEIERDNDNIINVLTSVSFVKCCANSSAATRTFQHNEMAENAFTAVFAHTHACETDSHALQLKAV